MATNIYEGLFILDTNSYNRDAAKVSGQIATCIKKHEGEMLVSRLWEERRLAYPINGSRKGTYWLTYFKLDGSRVSSMNRQFRLVDTILRSLVLKIDPRIADAMVQHALEGPKPDDVKEVNAKAVNAKAATAKAATAKAATADQKKGAEPTPSAPDDSATAKTEEKPEAAETDSEPDSA